MSQNKKLKIKSSFLKTKRQILKVPKDDIPLILEGIEKHNLKTFQELFDHLIISGLIYLNQDIVAYVDNNISEFIERDKLDKLSRMGKADKPVYPDYKTKIFYMYPKDMAAFSDFVIEKNYAKQWVSEILFKGFMNEEKVILDFIKKVQKLDIRNRKNQIARIAEDKWIMCLQPDDANQILEQLTENYENRKFGEIIQQHISDFKLKEKELDEDELLDKEIEDKMNQIRRARNKEQKALEKTREV